MKTLLRIGAGVGLAAGAYALFVRPRMLRWGATRDEVRERSQGANIIPDGKRSSTMAVTIDAPPSSVWPWLVQMGYDRAGWYSSAGSADSRPRSFTDSLWAFQL